MCFKIPGLHQKYPEIHSKQLPIQSLGRDIQAHIGQSEEQLASVCQELSYYLKYDFWPMIFFMKDATLKTTNYPSVKYL